MNATVLAESNRIENCFVEMQVNQEHRRSNDLSVTVAITLLSDRTTSIDGITVRLRDIRQSILSLKTDVI